MLETRPWHRMLLAFALGLLSTILCAQEAQIRVSTHEVWVDVSVASKRTGERIDGLTVGNFTVADAGKPAAELHLADAGGPPEPLTIALIIESDALTLKAMVNIQQGLNAALQKLRTRDEICIYRASPGFELVQPLTKDRIAIEQALNRIGEYQKAWIEQGRKKHGKSKSAKQAADAAPPAAEQYPRLRLTDTSYALLQATQYLRAQRPHSRIQLIAVTSDFSIVRTRVAGDVLNQILAAEGEVSALVTLKSKFISGLKDFMHVAYMRPDIRMQVLDQPAAYLAGKTGGMIFHVKDDDFEKALLRCLGDMTSRYTLFYRLDSALLDDRYHELKVNLQPPREDVRIRFRRGYFAWKQPPPAQPPAGSDNNAAPEDGLFYQSPTGSVLVPPARVADVKGKGLARAVLTWGISGVRLIQIFDKPKAAVQISQSRPLFLSRGQEIDAAWFVPLQVKEDHRELENHFLTEPQNRIAAQLSRMSDGTVWIHPLRPLSPGEYILSLDAVAGRAFEFGVVRAESNHQ
jgi:VWFA-related protein